MDKVLVDMLADFESAQSILKGPNAYGDSVRWPMTPRQPLDHVYLVYVRMDPDGLVVRQVEDDIGAAGLEQVESDLIRTAKAAPTTLRDFDRIVFKKASYLTIVLDQDGWDFYYPEPGKPRPGYAEDHDPILFTDGKTYVTDSGLQMVRPGEPNKAFYNLERANKTIDGATRAGIRCMNLFTNSAGNQVGHKEKIDYSFNIYLKIPYSSGYPEHKIIMILDPDGQNQGPNP